jgi:hypothetical protein
MAERRMLHTLNSEIVPEQQFSFAPKRPYVFIISHFCQNVNNLHILSSIRKVAATVSYAELSATVLSHLSAFRKLVLCTVEI